MPRAVYRGATDLERVPQPQPEPSPTTEPRRELKTKLQSAVLDSDIPYTRSFKRPHVL